jgi:O-methyltransferase
MRIILFGTGSGMRDFLSVLPAHVEVAGLSDNDARKQGTTILGYPVHAPASLINLEFDYVVVTTRAGEEIRNQLVNLLVPRDRILLYFAHFDESLRDLVNRDMEILNRDLGLGLHPVSLCTMSAWRTENEIDGTSGQDDYCRRMAIRLASDRILKKNVVGSIAELGVYKGETAAVLNRLFPDRTLYLFDTFEGFSENDLMHEQEGSFSSAAAGEFHETNVNLVLSRMANPDLVVVRKGYFPETASGLEDRFALVSLDVDLYKPTLAGLEYFYPRLSPGGCVFVHDYNNLRFLGVRKAVDEFIDRTGTPMVELPDISGTVILPK